MKRRAFLTASATAPLAGITAALPFAGVAGSEDDGGFPELLDNLEKLPPKLREAVMILARALAEEQRERMAADRAA